MASNQLDCILQIPMFTIYGLQVSNNATTPNTKLDIAAGICRDDQNNINMVLGSLFPSASNQTFTAPLTIDATVTGANGLDTGSLAASSVYAVYLIADSRGYKVPAGLLSLASNANPKMPFDYDSKRLVGYAVTDGSSNFLKMYVSGTGNNRLVMFDAPQATSVTAGNSATYASVALTSLVCPVNNTPVYIQSNYTANAAADVLKMQGFNSTGDAITIIAPVAGATAHTVTVSKVLAQLNTAAPSINYKVSAGTVALNVAGFEYSL